MDGMSWFRREELEVLAEREEGWAELRKAVLLTLASTVFALALALGLCALGVGTAADEFPSMPTETVG